jgi:hypothetical protein
MLLKRFKPPVENLSRAEAQEGKVVKVKAEPKPKKEKS